MTTTEIDGVLKQSKLTREQWDALPEWKQAELTNDYRAWMALTGQYDPPEDRHYGSPRFGGGGYDGDAD